MKNYEYDMAIMEAEEKKKAVNKRGQKKDRNDIDP